MDNNVYPTVTVLSVFFTGTHRTFTTFLKEDRVRSSGALLPRRNSTQWRRDITSAWKLLFINANAVVLTHPRVVVLISLVTYFIIYM